MTQLFPKNFVGVCQLPQSPGVPIEKSIPELERCVNELGFVGCNLSPDTSGGYWQDPPLTDRAWYPLYEKMVELDVPAMVHVSATCNPAFHQTGSHYLNADTTAFMQFMQSPQLFKDFPTLRFIIPHGGGAVPYHWGRYRGMNLDMGRPELDELLMGNVFFDTCVYHQPGIDLLFERDQDRQHPVRLGDDRRRPRQGPAHRRVFRRHEALRGCRPDRRQPAPAGLRRQRAQGLSAPGGEVVSLREAGAGPGAGATTTSGGRVSRR